MIGTKSLQGRNDIIVSQDEVQQEVAKYQGMITSGVEAIQDLESILGPDVVPRILHVACKVAMADIENKPRPCGTLLKFMPAIIKDNIDRGSSMVRLGVQSGLIPMDWVSQMAAEMDSAVTFCQNIKDNFSCQNKQKQNQVSSQTQ